MVVRVGRVVARVAVLAGAGLAVLLAGLPVAAPVWAHSRLLGTDPADGTTVTSVLPAVTLTFNEVVRADLSTVLVERAADHTGYGDGPAQVVDHELRQPVRPLRSGDYRVAWRAISVDGHPVQGEFRFTVALPPDREPAAATPDKVRTPVAGGGGPATWWWAAGAVVALVAVAAGLIRVRRRPVGTR
ncbi:copper resistance protein CopC [Micromonospora sp. NPDC050397]|uniref:copper resistance CopC family protein n=1 Tax=Micromonospora sp. NPDC050397 TaxID=3364279 RepID=UPI00384C36A4